MYVKSIDDLTFEEKSFIALSRRGMTNRDVAQSLRVSTSLVARTRKNPRKSSKVRNYLKRVIENTGLEV